MVRRRVCKFRATVQKPIVVAGNTTNSDAVSGKIRDFFACADDAAEEHARELQRASGEIHRVTAIELFPFLRDVIRFLTRAGRSAAAEAPYSSLEKVSAPLEKSADRLGTFLQATAIAHRPCPFFFPAGPAARRDILLFSS